MHDRLFYLQGTQHYTAFTDEQMMTEAAALGLNTNQFAKCLTQGKPPILTVNDALIKRFNVVGTPTILIALGNADPQPILGADGKPDTVPSLDTLKAAVDQLAARQYF